MAVRAECPFGSYQVRLASCGFIAKRDERLLPIWAGTEQNSETRGKSL
jgi:hypothetical protein